MKKFAAFIVLGCFFAGCQASGAPENGTGFVVNRGTVSQETVQEPDYLMSRSQQPDGVSDTQQFLSGPVQECLQETGLKADQCFEKFLKATTEAAGSDQAFSQLKTLYGVSAEVRAYCHPLAHAIGHAAVDKYPTVDQAYEHGSDFCWSGYYHGVMEEIMDRIGRKNLPSKLNDICKDIPGKAQYSFMYYNCVHGMGHGLMDVMGDNLKAALKMCDNLQGNWEQQSCYSGIFMQNVINDGLAYHTADLKPSDTVYPCNVVDQKYKDQCYLMQTSYMLKINGYDFKKTFDICANVDKGFSVTCYHSLGRDASGSTVSDLARTRANCLLGSDYTQQSECFVGAVKDFISYYHDDTKAKQLCRSLDDPSQATGALEGKTMAQYCLQTVADYYKTF